ncbi:MAG TPA: YqzL family protein [Defluviitaleaceae bacterium]|jgi:hypothetical protein|nr:YqzL family protein [Candidatus Epulonipiscium sp.]HOA79767.1 YqzL family protein [Defluviitaleaceae bacterium]
MSDKLFWNLFKKTGNIEAYLALKEYDNNLFNTESSKELSPEIDKDIKFDRKEK